MYHSRSALLLLAIRPVEYDLAAIFEPAIDLHQGVRIPHGWRAWEWRADEAENGRVHAEAIA